MDSATQHRTLIAQTVSAATGLPLETVLPLITRPKVLSHGDWAMPCFLFAKEKKVAPPVCAQELASTLSLPPEISKAAAEGPYLNFFLNRDVCNAQLVTAVLKDGTTVAKKAPNNRTILVEYSSPNIAKTIHVGHLRTTLIGLCIYRVLQHLGYNTISINHLGDWGTQFGFVYAGCHLWGKPENPTVDDLVELYVKATTLKKAQDEKKVPVEDANKPDVNALAREYFIRLEAADTEATQFWQWCLDVSLAYLIDSYDKLGIKFDHYTGESFYKDMVPQIESLVKESGILEDSRGALGVDLGKELGFVRVFAEDGRSLYITRDIAAALYRHDTYKPEKILYIVAAQQTLHFRQLVGIMEKMHHPVAKEIVHIPFGFVPGMKTRGGGAISLKDFLQEAYDHALKAYKEEVEKKPDGLNEAEIATKVSVGATYFYFLSHSNNKDFQFSWTEALSFQGDTGPYCQYALARLNSIIQKATEAGLTPKTSGFEGALSTDEAHELVGALGQFETTLQSVITTYEPNHLATYILNLAKTFSKAYRSLRVMGEEKSLAESRLGLFVAVRNTLHPALYLLGVPPVERM